MDRPSHRRLRRAISRYADDELEPGAAQALAAHLLDCDGCRRELATVRAIKGSLGRLAEVEPPALAATRLRRWTTNLPGTGELPALKLPLRDHSRRGTTGTSPDGRPRRSVGRGGGSGRTGRHPLRTPVGVLLVVAVAASAVTGALLISRPGASPDPGTVAALVELARVEPAEPLAGDVERAGQASGHTLELGSQRVSLSRHLVDGREVLVATSDRAFSMPADARPLGDGRDAPWLASLGGLGVACLSRPTHMLIVGPLPPERLVEIGRELRPL